MDRINRTRQWHAKWIWTDAPPRQPNAYCCFRRTFEAPDPREGCRIFVSADTRYQLFVNGAFVERGQPQSQPFYQYYDEHDVGAHLQPGTNCIALVVNHIGTLADTRGGLLLEMTDADGRPILCTDGSWRAIRAAAWDQNTHVYRGNKTTPYQEFFDARKEPVGWRGIDFNDSTWPSAVTVGAPGADRPPLVRPWTRLVARDIPFMTADAVLPGRIERVEESIDLRNRSRPTDLAPGLSLVGGPVRYARVEGAESLCRAKGVTTVQTSTEHRDLDFDGMYAPAIVLDFGRVITARSRITLCGAAGGVVEMGYAERLIDGHFNIAQECEFADRYTMKDGEQVFESFTWKAFRYLKIRFRNCFEPVELRSVEGVVTTYPYEERGGFSSSDDTLNAVFDIARATVRLCSNEFLMDTPWREQAQWLGDVALVTVPAIESCFGDTAITRKFFLQAGQNQHPTGLISNVSNIVNHGWPGAIPDYSLWWVRGLLEHFRYTGDEALLHRLYPQALRVLDAHLDYVNADGLIENMPYWVLIDWAAVETCGVCAAYNAIFYATLQSLHELAKLRSDGHALRLTAELRLAIAGAFHDAVFDADRGCYADARIDGTLSPKASEHGNMTPIFAGLCDDDTARGIIATVFESGRDGEFIEAQPFYMAVVLAALNRAGRFDLALDLIRRRWGKRMVDKGATSCFEEWYQNGSWRDGHFQGFQRSHSHAWSACPADFLIRALMGVEILEPGCRRLRVSPQAPGFDYRAVFPTPLGAVIAECRDGAVSVSADGPIALEVGSA